MWREVTGKVVFSRRLEWAFDSQKQVAALNFVYPALMWRLKYLRRAFSYAHGELQEKADEVSHPSRLMEVE